MCIWFNRLWNIILHNNFPSFIFTGVQFVLSRCLYYRKRSQPLLVISTGKHFSVWNGEISSIWTITRDLSTSVEMTNKDVISSGVSIANAIEKSHPYRQSQEISPLRSRWQVYNVISSETQCSREILSSLLSFRPWSRNLNPFSNILRIIFNLYL